jgi:hypothetical protein
MLHPTAQPLHQVWAVVYYGAKEQCGTAWPVGLVPNAGGCCPDHALV